MRSLAVVTAVVDDLVVNTKKSIRGRRMEKQAVPLLGFRQAEGINHQAVLQAGYQPVPRKRYSHLDLHPDSQPTAPLHDSCTALAAKTTPRPSPTFTLSRRTLPKRTHPAPSQSHTTQLHTPPKSTPHRKHSSPPSSFIPIPQTAPNRIVIKRVEAREAAEEQSMRQVKWESEQLELERGRTTEMARLERERSRSKAENRLKEHLGRGERHRYSYSEEGEIFLFKSRNTPLGNLAPQISYQLSPNTGPNCNPPAQSSLLNTLSPPQPPASTQRIESARGQAFSSCVMKTVNLSRIAINRTYLEESGEDFMLRNDLFNNNHARQTTSVPYLTPAPRATFTELPVPAPSLPATQHPANQHPPHPQTAASPDFKLHSARQLPARPQRTSILLGGDAEKRREGGEIQARPTQTAQPRQRPTASHSSRPRSSFLSARITTANPALAVTLLE